jgi:hypothetical protein
MPYTHSVTYSSSGTQPSVDFDPSIAPFNASITCTLLGGATASYKLQYTTHSYGVLDTDSNANWFDSPDIPAGTTSSTFASFITPVTRVRLIIASLSGGTLQMETIQGLSTN